MTTPRTHHRATVLADELVAVRAELARVDAKAATLTGLAGAATAFLVTRIGHGPGPVQVLLAVAGLALVGAAATLLTKVVRPRLGPSGFCRYASMTSDDVRRALVLDDVDAREHQARELVILARIATAKNRSLQRASDLL